MLGIELSKLSLSDLKRVRELALVRGQDALVRQVAEELAARASQADAWRHEPAAMGYAGGYDERPAHDAAAVRPRRNVAATAAGALAVTLAAVLAWGVSLPGGARLDGTPTARVEVAAQPQPLRAAVALAALDAAPLVEPVADSAEPERAAAPPARSETDAPKHNPCYDEATPADRLVCGYPALAQRERQMSQAYARALSSGADPRAIERDQADWKTTRDRISDWKALADAYDRRLTDLTTTPPSSDGGGR